MMEPKQLEELLAKAGGKYKLVTLFQKRMRELQRGLPKLTDIDSTNLWEIVSKEIMDSKVDIIMGEEAERMRKELAQREADEAAAEEKASKSEKAKAIKAPEAEPAKP